MHTLRAAFAMILFSINILLGCDSPGGGTLGDALVGQSETTDDTGYAPDVAAGPPRGTLFVAWDIPGGGTCSTRRIESIVVQLEVGGDFRDVGADNCGSDQRDGSLAIPEIPIGAYRVRIVGLDEAGNASNRGERRAEILSESTMTTHLIELELAPSSVSVTWVLPGGTRCAASGIAEIGATLVQEPETIGSPLVSETAPCDQRRITFDELVPQTTYGVLLRTFDASGQVVATVLSESFRLFPGEKREITIFVE